MSFSAWRFTSIFAMLLVVASPDIARADAVHDRATARSAADAGADAFDAGEYERALELFRRAEQIVHAPTHVLYIARSLVKLGRLVEAHEEYLKILTEQLPADAPKAFKSARAQAGNEIEEVETRVAYVTITVNGENGAKAVLMIDHNEVSAAEQGFRLPMDPGTHVFSAHFGHALSEEQTTTMHEGDKVSIALTLTESTKTPEEPERDSPPATRETAKAMSAQHPTSNSGPSPARRIAAYASFGLGAAGAGIGTYFLVSSISSQQQADQAFACDAGSDCSGDQIADVNRYDHEASVARTRAIVAYALGGAAVATGIVLFVTEPRTRSADAGPGRRLRVIAGLGSVDVSGTF